MSREYNSVRRDEGRYNLANPSEVEACYQFMLTDDTRQRFVEALGRDREVSGVSLLVGLEYDDDVDDESPLSCAESIAAIYRGRYLVHTERKTAEALVAALKPTHWDDRIAAAEADVRRLRMQLDRAEADRDRLLAQRDAEAAED